MGPSFRVGRLGGVPLWVHWSLPLGALWVGGLRFAPAAWAGYALVVLGHEMGHAVLVRGQGLSVQAIRLHALGGECLHEEASPLASSVIAWGGVLAQALLYALALLAASLLSSPASPTASPGARFASGVLSVLLTSNLWLLAINLLPLPGFDGYLAWRLPARLFSSRRGGGRGLSAAQRARLRERDVLPPADLFPGSNRPRVAPPRGGRRQGEAHGEAQGEAHGDAQGEAQGEGEPPPLPPEVKARLDELLKKR